MSPLAAWHVRRGAFVVRAIDGRNGGVKPSTAQGGTVKVEPGSATSP